MQQGPVRILFGIATLLLLLQLWSTLNFFQAHRDSGGQSHTSRSAGLSEDIKIQDAADQSTKHRQVDRLSQPTLRSYITSSPAVMPTTTGLDRVAPRVGQHAEENSKSRENVRVEPSTTALSKPAHKSNSHTKFAAPTSERGSRKESQPTPMVMGVSSRQINTVSNLIEICGRNLHVFLAQQASGFGGIGNLITKVCCGSRFGCLCMMQFPAHMTVLHCRFR